MGVAPAHLLLFGPPGLRLGDRVVALPTRKLLALLASLRFLGPTPRSKLVELLWDATDERARANLRGELYRLKKTGLGDLVEERAGRLALNGVTTDVEIFETQTARGAWAQALELRRGTLLEGLNLEDASEFEAFVSLERER